MSDELAREPIQQFGVARRVGPQAKITRRCDEPLAEVMHPNAVHPHAHRERVGRIDNRSGHFDPATAVGEGPPIVSGDNFQELPRDCFAGARCIPASEDSRLDDLGTIIEHDGVWCRLGV